MTTPFSGYQGHGLAAYAERERPDPLAKRPGESQENYERRTAIFRRNGDSAGPEEATQEWREHRARLDQSGGAYAGGMFGAVSAADRNTAAVNAFSGEQNVPRLGHLVHESNRNQPAPVRVYQSQTREPDAVSPLVRALRGEVAPSPTHESWT